jgi:hypothetical protein
MPDNSKTMSENKLYSQNMTTARVIEAHDGVEVVFLESARFYKLLKENPAFDLLVAALRDSVEMGSPVEVSTASPASSVIEDIKSAK